MTLKEANSERGKINSSLYSNLSNETRSWGLEIVRTELKEISPPSDVQETMNKVVKASNEKIAADLPVSMVITTVEEAKRQGARAIFTEKYGEKIMAAVDINEDKVALAGWKELTNLSKEEIISSSAG
jgi:regulator of protease activity HflC (stomatin/prohibitin superfamily)